MPDKYHYLPINQIQVPEDRQRSAMARGPLDELAQSIHAKGLMHPVVVDTGGSAVTLIAGARRLAAVTKLTQMAIPYFHGSDPVPVGHVPVVEYTDLSKLERYELEFEENHRREALSWQDQCKAEATLAELMREENPKVTQKAVAETAASLTGTSPKTRMNTLSQSSIVADYLHLPEVKSAKSLSKAYGVVSAIVEKEFAAASANRSEVPDRHTFIHGDLTVEMPKLTVRPNVIICDPPYGIGADKWSSGWATKHHYDDSAQSALALMQDICHMGYEISADDAHLYMFCDIVHIQEIWTFMCDAKWTPYNQPIIWHKGPQGYPAQVNHGLRRTYECIMYAIKGNARSRRIADDVIYCPASVPDKQHAAQKPVKLYVDLMSRHVSPGDVILDPCCGAGTVFPAAQRLFASGIGIEMSNTMAAVAAQAKRQAELAMPPMDVPEPEPEPAMGDDEL